MLSVGDLLWVPFTYSYTAYYLALHPKDIGLVGCAGVIAVQLFGYWIFRSSNNEKNEFRLGRNPKSELPRHRSGLECGRGTDRFARGLGRRPAVFPDRARHAAAHVRLVGTVAPPELVRQTHALLRSPSRAQPLS